jgi:hypothetical protein
VITLLCPYCGATAVLVGGDVIYPWRPDLAHKRFWKCLACPDAYVGCHPGTNNPLGRLADPLLRLAKQHAHAVFDPLWEAKVERENISKGEARGRAYRWLAEQLGIEPDYCHIGLMDMETCYRVVVLCRPYAKRIKAA